MVGNNFFLDPVPPSLETASSSGGETAPPTVETVSGEEDASPVPADEGAPPSVAVEEVDVPACRDPSPLVEGANIGYSEGNPASSLKEQACPPLCG